MPIAPRYYRSFTTDTVSYLPSEVKMNMSSEMAGKIATASTSEVFPTRASVAKVCRFSIAGDPLGSNSACATHQRGRNGTLLVFQEPNR